MSKKKNKKKQAGTRKLREIFGDTKPRMTCVDCGHIEYNNPKTVVGAVVASDDGRILLCRRAIEPRKGLWDIPEGYLEGHETTEAGAIRETLEEAGATIETDAMLGIYEIPHANNIKIIFRARMSSPNFTAGEESLEARLFEWDNIPWKDIAFHTVREALADYKKTKDQKIFAPVHKIIPPQHSTVVRAPKNNKP